LAFGGVFSSGAFKSQLWDNKVSSHPSDQPLPETELDAWSEEELEEEPVLQSDESTALFGSMLVHLIIILALALVPLRPYVDEEAVVIVSPPKTQEEKLDVIDDITYSMEPQVTVGANSEADSSVAEASAPNLADIAEIPSPVEMEKSEFGQIMVNNIFAQAAAPMDRLTNQKGQVGQTEKGAAGAVDRLTFEILQSLEERNTLVVWLFDQSGSLHRQRREIRDRFDRIYTELGIITEKEKEPGPKRMDHSAPLLTSIIGFGNSVTLYTETPTDDIAEIKSIVDNIDVDSSGVEKVFTAITSATDQYKTLRRSRAGNGPQRNVLFVVVTDERGDDENQLEASIKSCRQWGIPVYVIGVPAPFGRQHTMVKYVDPDPKYDQSPQWAQVDQGPETFLPERVSVGFTGNFQQEPVIDSGFGPYSLTRLCYETGGIYFTVHPNRNVNRAVERREVEAYASDLKYFFDPNVMSRYRPDYLSQSDYVRKVKASPLRQSLVTAAQMRPVTGLSRPRTRFVQVNIATLAGELTTAQQEAARLEPTLIRMAETLEPGMKLRESEESPRWRAGYDLAMGRVLAQKVRTETYNAMLAKAKRGMNFEKEKNNTWILEPSDEISVGSKWEREAATATELLTTVATEHDGTPWALLAKQELAVPLGWKWVEEFTDMSPPKANQPGNANPNPPAPQNDKKRMLKRAPKRPVPKL
jgi:hypothetical protein